MHSQWLNKENNKKFILFFNGWGMDENAVKHLKNDDFDILMIYDYRNYDLLKFDFSSYLEKYLVCWSMGVYVSNLFKDILDNFNKKIALSGTSKMIDNEFGIPQKIYDLTIRNFSDKSAELFIKNMFLDSRNNIKISRTTQELKEELIAIKNLKIDNFINYDKAYISSFDKIVPTKNQMKYWEKTNAEIIQLKTPHYPFNNFSAWQEIIC